MNKSRDAILLLGENTVSKTNLNLICEMFKITPVLATHLKTQKEKWLSTLYLENGKEVRCIEDFLYRNNLNLIAILNKTDYYVVLHAQLCQEFGVIGPKVDGVEVFKNKSEFHNFHISNRLETYRPKADIVPLMRIKSYLETKSGGFIVKPNVGVKSRAVLKVEGRFKPYVIKSILKKHFSKRSVLLSGFTDQEILVEEILAGRQITVTCFINHQGRLEILDFVEVINGQDLNLKHTQLVYRTNSTFATNDIKLDIVEYLQKVVDLSGLKSTFIHPEFIVNDERFWVIEINVRIGGFRSKMAKFAYDVDMDRMAIDLALGKEVSFEKQFENSVTAVEVWEEKSGIVRKLDPPKHPAIREMKVKFKPGDEYTAPPLAQIPLAQFYVVDEKDSLSLAKKLRDEFVIQID